MKVLVALLGFLLVVTPSFPADSATQDCNEHETSQISARLLFAYSSCLQKQGGGGDIANLDTKHLLIADTFIKARSYAWINKIAFWTSIAFAVMLLLWPSINIVFKVKIDGKPAWEWLKSPTIQTTIAGVAALSFAFYAEYKDKQTLAETLMRRTLYSSEAPDILVKRVTDELARIDRGFSFDSVFDKPTSESDKGKEGSGSE